MKTKLYLLTTLAVLFLSACAEQQVEEKFVRPIRSMLIQTGSHDAARDFSGTAQTDRVIDLSFRSGGIITKFDIKLGQKVNKGDLLAELDNVAARLSYEQARSSRSSAKSDYDTKQLNLQRVRELYEKGGASLSDYEAAKNAFRAANANYKSAQRSVEIQQEQIRYGKIIAPESGVIAAVNNEVNENVAAGQTVATLNAGTEMEIQLGLPESIINLVSPETVVAIRFSALANKAFAGKVKEVSPSINQQTATYPVRIAITDATDDVKAGMAATVTFDFSKLSEEGQSDEILVPASAVGEDSNGRYVFVVLQKDGTATVKKRVITIGNLVSDAFEVKSGLQVGDRIVTAGVHSVVDGQQVSISKK